MKNPLNKRFLRELKNDPGKYLVIFLLMVISIGFVSGFLVADNSMIIAYREGFTKYNVEDGHFTTGAALDDEQTAAVEDNGVKLYPLHYLNTEMENGTRLRIYKNRRDVNLICLMEGRLPENAGEIALDRMYADNNHIRPGDRISSREAGLIRDGGLSSAAASSTSPETTAAGSAAASSTSPETAAASSAAASTTSPETAAASSAAAYTSTPETAAADSAAAPVWTVTGLIAFPDYSCLFEDNNDTMFDSVQFGTAVLNDEDFDKLDSRRIHFNYAWLYDEKPASVRDEIDVSEALMKRVARLADLEDFIPRYANQAINFTGDDMGSDKASMIVFLYIIIVLIAFVFAISMRSTISKESAVIGTLLASGCTKREIVRHYMTLPVIVTLTSALIGNILGYTIFRVVCQRMYYNSYSLPTYVTVWNAEAFWMTTAVPLVLMLAISFFELRKSLRFSPLNFLRRELTKKKKARAVKLSHVIPFLRRYRLRVLFKNAGGYAVMLIGIFLAYTLLLFGLFFPDALKNYQKDLPDMMFADYQYMLKIPASMAANDDHSLTSLLNGMMLKAHVSTKNPDAEPFSGYSLKTTGEHGYMIENVTLFGVEPDSRYIDLDLSDGKVFASSACAGKFGLKAGDTLTLKEPYLDDTYDLTISGIYEYEAGIALFMDRRELNRLFHLGDDFFAGYLSSSEITDIDDAYIASVVDEDALGRISRQLLVSMGGIMYLLDVFALILFVIMIYLITRMIIDRNTLPISMLKILGSRSSEAGLLYIIPSMIITIAGMLLTIPLVSWLIRVLLVLMMRLMMPGWLPVRISSITYVKMILYGVIAYVLVMLLELRRIRKIPMEETLKHAE